jgi:putative membrane protein
VLTTIEFQVSALSSIVGFSSAFLSALLITAVIRILDKTSIVSLRRILAVFLAATVVWSLIFIVGTVYASLTGNAISAWNAFLYGAFLAACLELVVCYGAFSKSIKQALVLGFIHPFLLLTLVLKIPSKVVQQYFYAPTAGSLSVLVALLFLVGLRRVQTRLHGLSSIQLLQAFLKTWVSKNADDLEQCFSLYAKERQVKASIVEIIVQYKKLVLVVPGVHPGPFFPVGSYNLPGLLYAKFKEQDIDAAILHSTGGHERNLPTKKESTKYVESIIQFTESLKTEVLNNIKGPTKFKIGTTNISSTLFETKSLTTISAAPFESDDIEYHTDETVNEAAHEFGLDVLLVDAHNSIGGQKIEGGKLTDQEWKTLFASLTGEEEHALKLGYAHSSEIGFKHGIDISDAGISVLVFESDGSKLVLVVTDSNNAVVGLRENLETQLQEKGFTLFELCTSDTHNLAARTLTERGYFALGEATKPSEIADAIIRLVGIAAQRITICSYRVGELAFRIPLVGREPLDDFADVTRRGSAFAKTYAKAAAIIVLFLFVFTLI